jgi:hypothetical protein
MDPLSVSSVSVNQSGNSLTYPIPFSKKGIRKLFALESEHAIRYFCLLDNRLYYFFIGILFCSSGLAF